MLSIQLISLGVIAAQGKRYFEELFHLGTSIYRRVLPPEGEDRTRSGAGPSRIPR